MDRDRRGDAYPPAGSSPEPRIQRVRAAFTRPGPRAPGYIPRPPPPPPPRHVTGGSLTPDPQKPGRVPPPPPTAGPPPGVGAPFGVGVAGGALPGSGVLGFPRQKCGRRPRCICSFAKGSGGVARTDEQ